MIVHIIAIITRIAQIVTNTVKPATAISVICERPSQVPDSVIISVTYPVSSLEGCPDKFVVSSFIESKLELELELCTAVEDNVILVLDSFDCIVGFPLKLSVDDLSRDEDANLLDAAASIEEIDFEFVG